MEKQQAITKRQAMWGSGLSSGFVSVPTLLVTRQAELELSSQEVVVLLNLIAAWWTADNLPYPRTATIAQRSGLSVRAVQRHIKDLESKKLIGRMRNQVLPGDKRLTVTRYDLAGLVTRLQGLGRIPAKSVAASKEKDDQYLAGKSRPILLDSKKQGFFENVEGVLPNG